MGLILTSCSNSLTEEEKEKYTQKGTEITQATYKELSSNLMTQMKLGGPKQAIPFCHTEAMSITNSMEEKFNVTVKRTSDRIRNTNNLAADRELQIVTQYEKAIQNKSDLKPIVEKNTNGNVQFYAPIIIDAKCLVCHGKLGEELTVETDSLIKTLYPKDMAIGYKNGDVRGIWSIEFKNN